MSDGERTRPPPFRDFLDAWNEGQGLTTPALHARIADWLADAHARRARGLVLLAFRGSGKSTLVGLFCAWLLACEPDLRVLVLAAEEALARKMVRSVKRIVERHPACTGLKPVRAELWASDQFAVARRAELRDPSMLARGLAGNITGSRADIVICDDVEVPNTCDSALKRIDLRERLAEIDYVLVPGGVQLYVGTPHSFYSIYADAARPETGEAAPFLDGFERLSIPVVAPDGAFAWPERVGADEFERMRARTTGAKFRAQMMLEPVADGDCRLDPGRLLPYADALDPSEANGVPVLHLGGRRLVSAGCWWDPAYGTPEGDRSAIAVVFFDADGHGWLHEVAYLEAPDAEGYCREVAAFARRNRVPHVRVETNGLGAFLPGLLRKTMAQEGVGASVQGIHNRVNKARRILDAFDARLAAGMLHAHESVLASPFVAEMREWRADGAARLDDGLDAVAGCLAGEPARFGTSERPPPPGWNDGGRTHVASGEFTP
jgi:hypothetical protein